MVHIKKITPPPLPANSHNNFGPLLLQRVQNDLDRFDRFGPQSALAGLEAAGGSGADIGRDHEGSTLRSKGTV